MSFGTTPSSATNGGEETYQRFDYAAIAGATGSSAFLKQAQQDSEKLSLIPAKLNVDPTVIGRGAFGVVYKVFSLVYLFSPDMVVFHDSLTELWLVDKT
jgi:serine/threonine protein kinase